MTLPFQIRVIRINCRFLKYHFRNWGDLDDDLLARLERLKKYSAILGGEGLNRANAFQLAATDIFVEKAQIHLTKRALLNTVFGGILAAACVGAIIAIVQRISDFDVLPYAASWKHVAVLFLRAAAIAGFVGGGLYFLASLSRAFFHESATLFNRRHALRFGRMFIYLKYGEGETDRKILIKAIEKYSSTRPEPKNSTARDNSSDIGTSGSTPKGSEYEHLLSHLIHRDVDAEELEKAFGWNLETYTGFRDIKPEKMSASIYSKSIEVLGKMVESLAKLKSGGKAGD